MTTQILIEANRTQLVLTPESDHDRAVLKVLSTLPNTHRVDFYQTRAGYTHGEYYDLTGYGSQADQKQLAIVFDRAVPLPEAR